MSHIIVADLSRLARNVVDQGTTIATLKQLSITLVSVDEPIIDETAAGRLAQNMLGAFAQFFSDSLSERVRYRMKAGFEAGRFLHYAPIGYTNVDKELALDGERAPFVRKAFELVASGQSAATVLKLITSLGLTTRKNRPLATQSFARMLSNPVYAGWVVNGEDKVRGSHEPLISNDLFETVQDRLNGKSSPHKQLSEDFPLRGFVRCAACHRKLTAGWAKGRKERYPRYWCWTKGCRAVGISKDELEMHWVNEILGSMAPTDELLEQLPEIAARGWQVRKARIGKDAELLSKHLADQDTLNRRLITAKLNGEISPEDFATMKEQITADKAKIKEQITALDSERCTMQDLISQARVQLVDLVTAWRTAGVTQRAELANGLFPEGLVYSHKKRFFEPANTWLMDSWRSLLDDMRAGNYDMSDAGAGDGI